MRKIIFNYLLIAGAGFIQISISLYILFRISLFEIKNAIHATHVVEMKHNYLVVFVIFSYCLHLLFSGILLLRLKNYARLGSISNMFGLVIISLGCIFWKNSVSIFSLVFCIIFICAFIYFAYFLTRPETKKLFAGQ